MKVLLIGCGAVGIGVATALYDAQASLDLIARGKTKKAIEENGLKRIGVLNEVEITPDKISIYENINEINDKCYDFIVICTKTTQTPEIIEELAKNMKVMGDKCKIIVIQNGLEDEEMLLKHFSKEQVFSGRVFIGFTRPKPYISEVTVYSSELLLGSIFGEDIEELKPIAAAINSGGIPCKTAPEIGKNIWAKLLYNCALNPLGAILKVNYGKLIENDYSIDIMQKIIEEIYAVMKASNNETFWPDAEAYFNHFMQKLVPSTAEHRASTLQDIERQMKTEIDSLTGAVVKLARSNKIDVPYNEMIYKLIKSIEANY